MALKKPRLFVLISFLLFPNFAFNQKVDPDFCFTLSQQASTSAGIYEENGTLIRTLWSGRLYMSGKHKIIWDGTDDSGKIMPLKPYTAKVLSNNVNYKWEGVIGNTSDSVTGNSKHHSLDIINSMCISNNIAFCGAGYNEGQTSESKFSLESPQRRSLILPLSHSTNQSSFYAATDGINVYWAGNDPFSSNKWFVFGTNVVDDSELSFSMGKSLKMTYGRTYSSTIAYLENANGMISGLAVQKTRKFLFVARKDLNQIDIFNKTTGEHISTVKDFILPRGLALDTADNLWVIHGINSVSKYAIDSAGKFSALLNSIKGLIAPLALAVSPDNLTLLTADGGPSQQLKAFSNHEGNALNWTYGLAGGYSIDATVTNQKFYFEDQTKDVRNTFICYQPDGSFWVSDPGNFRIQHFSAETAYIERIMYLPRNYSVYTDPNNNTRLFVHYLEFAIDYSKTLMPNNGSWTLVKNWRGAIPSEFFNEFSVFKSVTTLKNGKTYGLLFNLSNRRPTVVELPSSGQARITSVAFEEFSQKQIYPDGSIRDFSNNSFGEHLTFEKQQLIGFDELNNPKWGDQVILASTSATTKNDPVLGGPHILPGEITSSGIIISFNGSTPPLGGSGYHLGGMKVGDDRWLWKTASSTHKNYEGEYPSDGSYDVGNYSQYSGNVAMVMDRSIIWGYNGEFWKASQTNKWNHVYDNGLFVGQFGITGPEVNGYEAPAMMAGNSFSPSLVKVDTQYYLYHNDESYHSGIHRWKITGLNTIFEQNIILDDRFTRTSELPALEGIDLMEGLPFDSILPNNCKGWSRTPALEDHTDRNQVWSAKTSVMSFDKRRSPDLWVKYGDSNGPFSITRDLGTNRDLASWKLAGKISYEGNMPNTNISMFMDILDASGKILARFYTTIDFGSPNIIKVFANSTLIASGKGEEIQAVTDRLQPIEVAMEGPKLIIKYAKFPPVIVSSFEMSGEIGSPKSLRLLFNYVPFGNTYAKLIDIQEMRFVTTPNFALQEDFNFLKGFQHDNCIQLDWNYTSDLPQEFEIARSSDAKHFAKIGSLVISKNSTGQINNYTYLDSSPNNGENYYIVRPIEGSKNKQNSKIVRIDFNRQNGTIEVFPNPVVGYQLKVKFNNVKQGSYKLSLINNNGSETYTRFINHPGGSSVEILPLKSDIRNGLYNLQILDKQNVSTKKIIVLREGIKL